MDYTPIEVIGHGPLYKQSIKELNAAYAYIVNNL